MLQIEQNISTIYISIAKNSYDILLSFTDDKNLLDLKLCYICNFFKEYYIYDNTWNLIAIFTIISKLIFIMAY